MKGLKDFLELMTIVWKDKVDVAMLVIWAIVVIYFFRQGHKFEVAESDMFAGLLYQAASGLGFFWLYGFTAVLRTAWFKRKLNK